MCSPKTNEIDHLKKSVLEIKHRPWYDLKFIGIFFFLYELYYKKLQLLKRNLKYHFFFFSPFDNELKF